MRHPLYYAYKAPFDVIKLLIDIYPEGFQYVPFETLPPSTLVALAKEKVVKENEDAAENVAEALYNIALSESGRQACINSGAPSALVLLSQQEVVIANPFTRDIIFKSLAILSSDPIGSQLVSESLYIIYGPLSLYPAVCIGILSVVISLLDQYDININADEGKAVQFAIDNNLVDIRDILLARGATLPRIRIQRLKRIDMENALQSLRDKGEPPPICGICFEILSEPDDTSFIAFPECEKPHFFHRVCIFRWARLKQENTVCPMCIKNIFVNRNDTGASNTTNVPDSTPLAENNIMTPFVD
jgi:hypothetical protein